MRAVGVASAVAGYLGQQHIIISFFVCTRRGGAGRRRYRRGASPTQTKASLHTKEVKDIAGASLPGPQVGGH